MVLNGMSLYVGATKLDKDETIVTAVSKCLVIFLLSLANNIFSRILKFYHSIRRVLNFLMILISQNFVVQTEI